MQRSPQQERALVSVRRWLDGERDLYRLFGYAGTGKTTLAKEFADGLSGRVFYAAYTGKAANVLQRKGCADATTIHRLIYKPAEKNKERLRELLKEVEDCETEMAAQGKTPEQINQDVQLKKVREELELEKTKHKRPSFQLNPDAEIKDAALIIIDECSMVDRQVAEDLLSYKRPVLVLGDPAQLPPVMGSGYFTNATPDSLLTEVHRQAAGNPVLRLATDVREGRGIHKGEYGDSRVISKADVDKDEVLSFDQVLVGTNKLRHSINARFRELRGRAPGMPVPGDRVVCLKNNHKIGLLNGSLWDVTDCVQDEADTCLLSVKSTESELTLTTSTHTAYFLGKEPPFWAARDHDSFDYGYALTCHKAQGSQWDNVFIFDESRVFRADARRWLYTALTRAAKRVVVAN